MCVCVCVFVCVVGSMCGCVVCVGGVYVCACSCGLLLMIREPILCSENKQTKAYEILTALGKKYVCRVNSKKTSGN